MHTLNELRLLDFKCSSLESSSLTVFQQEDVSFFIKRVFVVVAQKKVMRGCHAHKNCSQLLVCTIGSCIISCDDGIEKKNILLNKTNQGLLIPPLIWATQEYLEEPTVLTVFCDRVYEEDDYIRDYNQFLKFRGLQ